MIRWRATTEKASINAPQAATVDAGKVALYRQGDHLPGLTDLPVLDAEGVRIVSAPHGAILLAQTCDIVRAEPPTVQVAPLRYLSGEDARSARDGKRPRFVHVPELGGDAFADLDVIATMNKIRLTTLARQPGVISDEHVRDFGRAVGRRPGRFAFPDEIVPWLNKLQDLISSKSRRPASPEGQLINDQIMEVRVEASRGWAAGPPWDITLVVLVKLDALPTFANDDPPEPPEALQHWLYGNGSVLIRSASDIAQRLGQAATSDVERYYLWGAFAESWALKCQPPESQRERGSVDAEVVSDDQFTTNRYRRSERLDLDHLSPPAPL